MEWDPADRSAGANYFFLTSTVAPRPIAWVTTKDPQTGVVNAAPFSWFQTACADPPLVMIAFGDRKDGSPKDTLRNIQASGEFVVNAATRATLDAMVATSGDVPSDVSEPDLLGLDLTPSHAVAAPRLAASPVHLECRLVESHRYGANGDAPTTVVVGRVVHCAADDDVLDERGNVDPRKVTWVARLGGAWYTAATDLFEHRRPKQEDLLRQSDPGDADHAPDG